MEAQNFTTKKYSPINVEFYETLQSAAALNQPCEIIYSDEEGLSHNVISKIADLFTKDEAEFAVLEDNTILRLDQIKSFNGELENNSDVGSINGSEDFGKKFYASEEPILVGDNEFYELWVDRINRVLELKVLKLWTSLDSIPDLKAQSIQAADYLNEKFGLINDLTALPFNNGVLEAPFMPARGLLINAGLRRVADILPLNCETIVHNRGSFSVNSVEVKSFQDRYFGWNWVTER